MSLRKINFMPDNKEPMRQTITIRMIQSFFTENAMTVYPKIKKRSFSIGKIAIFPFITG